jgi:hypothetical protein
VAFLLESIVEENELSQEEAQKLWNEEADKLDAGDQSPAFESQASAPETPPQETLEPEAASTQAQAADPLAGLPEEVKIALGKITQLEQANAQLLHHVKTTEGRVAAMQREAQQARQAATSVDAAPSQGQMAAAAKNPEKWEQLKQDFPEWAGAMEEYVASKMGDQQQQNLTPEQVTNYVQQQVAQTRAEMGRLMEEARIEGKYENWRDTVNTTEFAQWFTVQSPETRALADSSAARDAIKMLDMFNTSKSVSATEIKQERGARLAAAATTRTGQTPPPKTLGDMSPAELWNYEAKKRERELKERGY